MEWEEYCRLSEKTEKKFPNGLKIDPETYHDLMAEVDFIVDEDQIGKIKKKIIYTDEPVHTCVQLNEDQIELLHAAIGVYSEAVELLDVIFKWVKSDKDINELDVVNVSEELADSDWYRAIFSRKLGIMPVDGLIKNIEKLKFRYGDKFTNEGATNRDLRYERVILETMGNNG